MKVSDEGDIAHRNVKKHTHVVRVFISYTCCLGKIDRLPHQYNYRFCCLLPFVDLPKSSKNTCFNVIAGFDGGSFAMLGFLSIFILYRKELMLVRIAFDFFGDHKKMIQIS